MSAKMNDAAFQEHFRLTRGQFDQLMVKNGAWATHHGRHKKIRTHCSDKGESNVITNKYLCAIPGVDVRTSTVTVAGDSPIHGAREPSVERRE